MNKLILLAFILFGTVSYSQQVIDEIFAVIGGEIVMKSEIESQYLQTTSQGFPKGESTRGMIKESLLLQALLLHHGKIDSVQVNDAQIDQDVDRKMQYFLAQMGGSPADLERQFGKTYLEVKDDLREVSKNAFISDGKRREVTSGVKITPEEVKEYYESLPQDSLPLVSESVEIGHIVINPEVNKTEKERVRAEVNRYREEILNGASFETKALLYSQDPGSARRGGELGFVGRGQLVPEFEAVAFNLKENEISDVVESAYGFHVIQLIEKRGQMVNVRHILRIPRITYEDQKLAKDLLDSIHQEVTTGKLAFDKAAVLYSQDENSSGNSGVMINPQTGTSLFDLADLDSRLFKVIENVKVGEYTDVMMESTPDGKSYYHFITLKSKNPAHTATLETDYKQIYDEALLMKQKKALDAWVKKEIKKTYIQIKEGYHCSEIQNWIQ